MLIEGEGRNVGKIESVRNNMRSLVSTGARRGLATVRDEVGAKVAYSRLGGAIVRGILMMVLVIIPSVILPGVDQDTRQMVALLAIFAGLLTYSEYRADYPCMIEFCAAPPFNRIRYVTLLVMVVALSALVAASLAPSPFTRLFEALSSLVGNSADFPYSPVRLATLMLAGDATPAQELLVRSAAGMAYLLSLLSVTAFVLILKLNGWPSRHYAFNVWINLPTFDPSGGDDVVERLERDSWLNLSLGFLLPFLVPAAVNLLTSGLEPLALTSPQTLIWTMIAWAFLPASLLMRGVAMGRIAAMIRSKRGEGRVT